MPLIKPFTAFRYDPHRVDPARVVAPAREEIDDRLRGELCARDPLNVVRLIPGRGRTPYADAAGHLARWIRDSILVRDPRPAIYFLEQEFRLQGRKRCVREGFIAACRLEEFGDSVLPQEKTGSGQTEDRLQLMEATGAMFSQIFALYPDPGARLSGYFTEIRDQAPEWEAVYDGVRHTLRLCLDARINLAIAGFLRDARVVIADGHDWYETALAYRGAMRLKNPDHDGHEPYNFVPMYFSGMHDPGMIVLPTHRLLRGLPGFDPAAFLRNLRTYFTVSAAAGTAELMALLRPEEGSAFGVVTAPGGGHSLLRLNDRGAELMENVPAVTARFDVSVLQRVIFEGLLGFTGDSMIQNNNVDYERDERLSVRQVLDGSCQAAFLMKPPPMGLVTLAAEAGCTLPWKSTYYFPKLLSGVVNYICAGESPG